MAELNCTACEELKSEVPELIVNGFDNDMATSLKNDTGLKASSGNNDCTDLDTMNDCLIGNAETEIDDYDTCTWKTFMKDYISNMWTMFKAIISAICGLWTNVHNLWTTIRSLCITRSGRTITLTSNLGNLCSITLPEDQDTKYDLTISGHTVTLTGTDGSSDSVTVPDEDTKYGLSISGQTISIVEGGSNTQVTVPTFTPALNTVSADGYVEKGQGQANKVWKTDANGNPAWRDEETSDISCIIDYLSQGDSFSFGETAQTGKESKVVKGKGVDFTLRSSSDEHSNDVRIVYIAGGLGRFGGSLRLFTASYYDADGNQKSGNSNWDFSDSSVGMPKGGELLFTVRIKKSEYPQIKKLYNGALWPTGGNEKFFQAFAICFDGDDTSSSEPTKYAYGQHGWCDRDGTPSESGYSDGTPVPAGWLYLQARMLYKGSLTSYNVIDGQGTSIRGADLTPQGFVGIRMNVDEIEC